MCDFLQISSTSVLFFRNSSFILLAFNWFSRWTSDSTYFIQYGKFNNLSASRRYTDICRVFFSFEVSSLGFTCWIVSSVRLPGPNIPFTEVIASIFICPYGWRSSMVVSRVSHKFVNAFTRFWSYKIIPALVGNNVCSSQVSLLFFL